MDFFLELYLTFFDYVNRKTLKYHGHGGVSAPPVHVLPPRCVSGLLYWCGWGSPGRLEGIHREESSSKETSRQCDLRMWNFQSNNDALFLETCCWTSILLCCALLFHSVVEGLDILTSIIVLWKPKQPNTAFYTLLACNLFDLIKKTVLSDSITPHGLCLPWLQIAGECVCLLL